MIHYRAYGQRASSNNRLWQLGSTAIGMTCTDGILLAVEKRTTSPLMEPSSIEKIVEIDAHIGQSVYFK